MELWAESLVSGRYGPVGGCSMPLMKWRTGLASVRFSSNVLYGSQPKTLHVSSLQSHGVSMGEAISGSEPHTGQVRQRRAGSPAVGLTGAGYLGPMPAEPSQAMIVARWWPERLAALRMEYP